MENCHGYGGSHGNAHRQIPYIIPTGIPMITDMGIAIYINMDISMGIVMVMPININMEIPMGMHIGKYHTEFLQAFL